MSDQNTALEIIEGEIVSSSTALALPSQPNVIPESIELVNAFVASKTSIHSQRTMSRSLDTIAQLLAPETQKASASRYSIAWWRLTPRQTELIRSELIRHYKPASVNVMLSALRGILERCWKDGLMTAEDYHRARDIDNAKNDTLPAGREITQGEILALLNTCNNDLTDEGNITPLGARDAAIIAVLYTGGLRRTELATLKLGHYNPENGGLFVRGKGRKERITYLPESARFYIQRWLELRNAAVGDDPEGVLFTPVRRGGHIKGNPLTSQTVYDALKARADQAGVKDFSPHDFRRTLIGDLLDRKVDIATVAKMVGHASVLTTARYDRRPEQAKQKAAELVSVPLPGKLL